jgi:hypothetical protein
MHLRGVAVIGGVVDGDGGGVAGDDGVFAAGRR